MTDTLYPEQMFHVLPEIYDQIGFSDYATNSVQTYLDFLFQNGWVGRHILEIGCGTGTVAEYLAQQSMNVTALDVSAEMLEIARERTYNKGYSIQYVHRDMLAYTDNDRQFDLILSINTMNYVPSVRHLGSVFSQVNKLLRMEKVFMFDLWTVEGLATLMGRNTEVLYDAHGVFATVRNNFSYDSYRLRQQYTFFYERDGRIIRGDEEHMMRGYPVSPVTSMLTRAGFAVRHVLDLSMNPFEHENDLHGRIIVIAEKIKDLQE